MARFHAIMVVTLQEIATHITAAEIAGLAFTGVQFPAAAFAHGLLLAAVTLHLDVDLARLASPGMADRFALVDATVELLLANLATRFACGLPTSQAILHGTAVASSHLAQR